jgi:WhiB family transcriptional regulator, redox-sensing transcriptional regulator
VAINCDAELEGRSPLCLASGRTAATMIGLDQVLSDNPDLPCRAYDPDLWFAESPTELELAKSFCADCAGRAACLAGALARREPWGVWGGEIFDQGRIVARKRPRGRPRKADRERVA